MTYLIAGGLCMLIWLWINLVMDEFSFDIADDVDNVVAGR